MRFDQAVSTGNFVAGRYRENAMNRAFPYIYS
jgi:hypothetical protein